MIAMWPVLFSLALSADQVVSEIAADEVVVFYPTYAHRTTEEKSWVLHVHGRIFEPEEDSLKRAALLGMMRRSFGLSKQEESTATFKERMRAFLVDNEGNKTIHIRLGESVFRAGKSGPNGHFSSDLVLSNEQVAAIQASTKENGRTLRFTAIVPADDGREFAGQVELIERRGLSVISDVDDTIKISEVANRRALLANTFLREYKPVPGMPALYQRWENVDARFHYVSASPWQLYHPIANFLAAEKFPAGSLHMKMFRLHDRSALALLATQHKYKPEVIAKILSDFPERRFVLVGDSGEQDPEIYGELARRHPEQVARILIRHVGAREGSELRYQAAFKEIPPERWQVFTDPEEILGVR
ncbi:MAG: App1 family protein [Pirellulales bacterium]